MGRLQTKFYEKAKYEFAQQMDPSDKSRFFYIDRFGNALGFRIIRKNGGVLEYNVGEDKYINLGSTAEPSTLDIWQEDGVMDLPPYDYSWKSGKDEQYETHHFPDPATSDLYHKLTAMQQESNGFQYQIALAMTQLPEGLLEPNEMFILANKAVLMNCASSHGFALEEITSAINDLILEGAAFTIDKHHYEFCGATVKKALLSANQEGFQNLIAASAENSRQDGYEYSGSDLSYDSMQALSREMGVILPYLRAAETNSKISLDHQIHSAREKNGGSATHTHQTHGSPEASI